jgi:predicted TIM-barrel fold metal-dependent hydrolase
MLWALSHRGRPAGSAAPTIVVNHLGSPRLGRGDAEDAAVLADWRKGVAALAALPNVFIKLSMLDFVRKVRGLFRKLQLYFHYKIYIHIHYRKVLNLRSP